MANWYETKTIIWGKNEPTEEQPVPALYVKQKTKVMINLELVQKIEQYCDPVSGMINTLFTVVVLMGDSLTVDETYATMKDLLE